MFKSKTMSAMLFVIRTKILIRILVILLCNRSSNLLCPAMKIRRPWTTKHWCKSVIDPEWPFAYSKYEGQAEEIKGRVSSNKQDVRHRCETQGVQSKCHICEDIICGKETGSSQNKCHFQLQGVSWDKMSKNIPTVTDIPWAVGGAHRYDYGGENTTHVCMYMSGKKPCQSHLGNDYGSCVVRCWGYMPGQLSGKNNTAGPTTRVHQVQYDDGNVGGKKISYTERFDSVGIWPNLELAFRQNGLNTTPWVTAQPTATWSYPKSNVARNNLTYNVGPELELLPQGFTFTLAGSPYGEEGFQDGKGPEARFRYPEGITVNNEGYVFVADTRNHAIRMITPSGTVTTLAGNGQPGFTDGSTSKNIQFSSPSGIAIWQDPTRVDTKIEIFVSDTGNHRIRKLNGYMVYDKDTKERIIVNITSTCFCGNCEKSPQAGFANGNRNKARFDNPTGITIGGSGTIFVADSNNHLIRMVDQLGEVNTLAGKLRTAELNKHGGRLEGCPDPCLTGSQGHEDGELSQAKFSFPLGIALSPDESYLLVTSRHYLRKIDLGKNLVMTANGENRESEVDGKGKEASFNKPHGVAITKDGYAFIVDSASCRIRRAATPRLFAAKLSCTDSVENVFRPSGCFSYNPQTDQHGLMVTSRAGYIQYNYNYQNWTNKDLGKDFIGRVLKNCVGAPPIDTLDKNSWDDHTLVIDDGNSEVREDPNEGSLIQVLCSTNCSSDPNFNPLVYGTRVQREGHLVPLYTSESPICIAAAHSGLLDESSKDTFLDLTLHQYKEGKMNHSNFMYTFVSGLEEKKPSIPQTRRFYSLQRSSMDLVIQSISGSPSAKRGEFCGFKDSIPAQDAEFNIPTSISVFANGTLDDKNNFLYVADRDNHVVRAISATCSFVCENGGRCIGTDKCSCSPGWQGVDCSIPICLNECDNRQICVGPDKCKCIPGYKGSDCTEPTCAQSCENGGLCTAPDTCSCLPGWFDSNCTTPVCNQTCGNGGNCTAPNHCSCPNDWKGPDCRSPVCEQQCLNGGICIAPNTCACPPSWSGYNCSEPICHQGYFQPYDVNSVSQEERIWMEYVPCNIDKWCNATNGFDCSQQLRKYIQTTPLYGPEWRFKTGMVDKPSQCFMIELMVDAISPFQYINSSNNEPTIYQRYTNVTPNDWFSDIPQVWNAKTLPNKNFTKPWSFVRDRQVALVETRYITQGSYKCANNGNCVAPDTCACSKGWMGFDCRVPICEQGYYEGDQQSFVKGISDAKELDKFKIFLHSSHSYFLDTKDDGYSNPHFMIMQESFLNHSFVHRISMKEGGRRYLHSNGNEQGGYECSIRSVTEWEDYRSGAVFEHPNYYSRYMDKKVEGDGKMYTHWEEMGWDPLFRKTQAFQIRPSTLGMEEMGGHLFVYTDQGYKRDGFWFKTNFSWTKGYCIIEFERTCNDPAKERDLEANASEKKSSVVQDTDLSFRPRIYYDNDMAHMVGEWRIEGGECIDQVIRGCFNNGTCVGPNTCQCAEGWTGYDCTLPICNHLCQHNGNCTLPNTCTCEKGWTGIDCSIPICAQNCNNGGKCVAPDTCKCVQWQNTWWDGRFHGGVPLYQTPEGDPQMTGWTGYDCSTPICVQAERFVHNVNRNSYRWNELLPLGGHGKDGTLRCNEVKCPEFDEIVTMNDGESFQSGCGFDPIETGCCFETKGVNIMGYICFTCVSTPADISAEEQLMPCSLERILKYDFQSILEVPNDFKDKRTNKVNICGSKHDPLPIKEANLTSQRFLCERHEWEQGDFIDDAGLEKESAIGGSHGLVNGRHIRVNYHNYVRDDNDLYNWTEVYSKPGEGVFACYNAGSCIKPDVCTCRDGYTGFDCKTPLCRHQQKDGTIVGCLNNGECTEKDSCKCQQEQSILWMKYDYAERGITGWSGSDCSMPICSQGYYDPKCSNNPFAAGGEGCYRCQNDGLCVAPDICQCADGWTGFDCKTPVCRLSVTPLLKKQLMTVDENKIKLFENDPCGMKDFHEGNLFKSRDYRGFCALPNQCACHCKGIHDIQLCKAFGGEHCNLPFQDRLHRFRNVLAPNEIFGTRSCFSGYEGAVDDNDKFVSCHLNIYEPSYLVEKSISLFFWGTFLLVFSIVTIVYYRMKLQRKNLEEKIKERRIRRGALKPSNFDAFSSFRDLGTSKID